MGQDVKFRIEMAREELSEAQTLGDLVIESVTSLQTQSVGLEEARFIIDPVSVLVIASAATLIHYVVHYFLKAREQGLQIDLQTMPPTISFIANVPRGFVVIIDKSGKPTVHQGAYDKPEALAALLSPLEKHAPESL
jgi:hypothetical protein